MSYPGYPHQGSNSQSSQHPHQPSFPYPANSVPDPSSGGVNAPSLDFNVDSPIPEAYPETGYPSSTIGASYNLPYPTPSSYSSSHNLPYPSNQRQSRFHSSYRNPYLSVNSSNQAYPQPSSYPSNQGQSRSHLSYPNPSLSVNPSNQAYPQPSSYPSNQSSHASNQSQTYPSPYQTHTHPFGNQGHSHPPTSLCPSIGGSNSPHHSEHGRHSNPTPFIKGSPTVVPVSPFHPHEDAAVLKKAMRGVDTDLKAIINVLTRRSNAQRSEIAVQFQTIYSKDLITELNNNTCGKLNKLIVILATPLLQYYVTELHDNHMLADYTTIFIELVTSLNGTEMRMVREAYKRVYRKNLESVFEGKCGHYKRFMVSLSTTCRGGRMVTNKAAAAADARALCALYAISESSFNMIFCERNPAQLRLIFQEYQKIRGQDIEDTIKSNFSSTIRSGLLTLIHAIKNQEGFISRQLYKSIDALRTTDRHLIRLIVTRCERDMGDIKIAYAANQSTTLADAIRIATYGVYSTCLLALIGEA